MNLVIPPNKEQILFAQLQVAEGLLAYAYENTEGTIYEEDAETYTLLAEALVTVTRTLVSMHAQMVKSCQERKSVCY